MLKTVSSVINAIGALNYQGTWNASTNTPTLTSGVGTKGDYYVVSVAGSTNLDGTTLWGVGDWAVFNGSIWQKVDGGSTGDFTNLSVSGTATFSGQLVNSVMFLNASKNLATDSSFSYDSVNGRLGVGTNSPGAQIQITGATDSYIRISSSGAANSTGIKFIGTGTDAKLYIGQRNAGDTASVVQAVIDNSGNLGIGTSSPNRRLDVQGDGSVYASVTNNTSGSGSARIQLFNNGDTSDGFAVINNSGASGQINILNYKNSAMAFWTNSAQRMLLDSSGNLGIGTSSPSGRLNIATATDTQCNFTLSTDSSSTNGKLSSIRQIRSQYDPTGIAASIDFFRKGGGAEGEISFATNPGTSNGASPTERMRIDSSGNVLVGTTNSYARLFTSVADGTKSFGASGTTKGIRITHSSTSSEIAGVDNTLSASYQPLSINGSYLAFSISGAEKMRLDTSGNLLVGKTAANGTIGNGYQCSSTGVANVVTADTTSSFDTWELYSTGASAFRFYVTAAGVVNATNTTISAISDQRLKENIQDLDVGLDKIMALKPRKFDWKAGKGKDIKGDRGFIAQEFETVFPDLIDQWKDPAPEGEEPYKSVRADLIPVLVKAMQEQQVLIEKLTARVSQLEGA